MLQHAHEEPQAPVAESVYDLRVYLQYLARHRHDYPIVVATKKDCQRHPAVYVWSAQPFVCGYIYVMVQAICFCAGCNFFFNLTPGISKFPRQNLPSICHSQVVPRAGWYQEVAGAGTEKSPIARSQPGPVHIPLHAQVPVKVLHLALFRDQKSE